MINLKSTSQTKQTFTMTFNIDQSDISNSTRQLKALSILFGNYNPLQKEMTNKEVMLETLTAIRESGRIDEIIAELSIHLK